MSSTYETWIQEPDALFRWWWWCVRYVWHELHNEVAPPGSPLRYAKNALQRCMWRWDGDETLQWACRGTRWVGQSSSHFCETEWTFACDCSVVSLGFEWTCSWKVDLLSVNHACVSRVEPFFVSFALTSSTNKKKRPSKRTEKQDKGTIWSLVKSLLQCEKRIIREMQSMDIKYNTNISKRMNESTRHTKKMNFSPITERFQKDVLYRNSQLVIGRTEEHMSIFGLAHDNWFLTHNYAERASAIWEQLYSRRQWSRTGTWTNEEKDRLPTRSIQTSDSEKTSGGSKSVYP